MEKIRGFVIIILLGSMLLAACGPAATTEPTQAPEPTTAPVVEPTKAPEPTEPPAAAAGLTCEEPVKVGLITDGTGPLAIYGAHILRSFMLGMEYATGAPGSVGEVFTLENARNTFKIDNCEIEVIVGDDQGNADTTTALAREMIEVEQVDFLVGTVSSGNTATLQGIAAENKVPLIVAPAAANDITGVNFNPYTFRTSRNNYQDAINLCQYLPTVYDTFVQIAPDYSFGWGGAQAFRDSCTTFGGQFVADDIFAPLDTTDFTPYMEQILDSGAQAWIVTWAGGGFIPMMQAAVDVGVTDEMSLGASFVDNIAMPAFFANTVGTTSGILYHYIAPQNNPINDWLVEQTKARYGVPPDLFDADGMNAAILLVEALKATNGNTDPDTLVAAMEGIQFEGPKGTIYIRPEDHVAIQDMYIVKLLNVTDPEAKFFEYVTTTRPEPPCLLPENLKDRCADLPYGSLGGAAAVQPEPVAAINCEEPVKVGLITDGTGPLAIYGAHILRSFMLGMEYATGAPGSVGEVFTLENARNTFKIDNCEIEVIVGDDQGNADTTTALAREMIEVEQVDFLVGTVSSGNTATLQGIAAENKVPLIVAPAAANDITGVNFNPYTFRTSRNNYQDAINLCQYLPTVYDTFVQIAPDYSFGWGGAQAFRDSCTTFGGQFVADDIFAPLDTTDFTPYMEQILDSGAQAWIVTWAGGGFIPMMQAAVDVGVTDEMSLGASFVDNIALPAFFANAVGTTSGILYHYIAPQNNPINDWLVEQTKARYGVPPDLFDADGMNAAILLVEALKATNGNTDPDTLVAAMEGIQFEGPKGTIYIRPEDHVAIQDMYIVKLLNVTDPEAKFFEYVTTTRPEPPCLLPENLKDRCADLPYGSLGGE